MWSKKRDELFKKVENDVQHQFDFEISFEKVQKDIEMSKEAGAIGDSRRDDYIGAVNLESNIYCLTVKELLYTIAAGFMLYGVALNGLGGYILYKETYFQTVPFFLMGAGFILIAAVLFCILIFGFSLLWMFFIYTELFCVYGAGYFMLLAVKVFETDPIVTRFTAFVSLLACQLILIFILAVVAVVMWILGKDCRDDKDTTPIS